MLAIQQLLSTDIGPVIEQLMRVKSLEHMWNVCRNEGQLLYQVNLPKTLLEQVLFLHLVHLKLITFRV